MPELIEAEQYRAALTPLLGERVMGVDLRDPTVVRPRGVPARALTDLVGLELRGTRRVGKLVVVDLASQQREATLGLRFGMTGRLLVDGAGPIDRLVYSSSRDDPEWDRIRLTVGPAVVSLRDPRRLGSVVLAPDTDDLGVDATEVDATMLGQLLRDRRAALKATLLNQAVIAGLGNLLIDETLWRAAISPERRAGGLDRDEIERLSDAIHETLQVLSERGGSHTGDTFPERHDEGVCPLDGEPMRRSKVGGRTSWWCPAHQR